jgi:WD40 repeat protein
MHIFFHDGSLGGVRSASVSPDTRFIVTAYSDKARVWDLATGRPVTPPLQHRGNVFHASFSPDGRLVVSASDDGAAGEWTARVWNATTGQLVAPPFEHDGSRGFQPWFSPDGRRLMTICGDDHTVRVWDVNTGRPITPPMRHRKYVNHAAFSPDGRRVVTASQDSTAQVWDAITGQPVTPPLVHPDVVWDASFSPDGHRVITISSDARLWDASTGQLLLKYPGGHFASFSPDGRRVVTRGVRSTVRVCDATTGQTVTPLLPHGNWVMLASFSPDGRRVVTADLDGTVRLWHATTGEPLSPPLRHQSRVHQAMFSPDGCRVVTTCFEDREERLRSGQSERVALARVWNMASQQTQPQTFLHQRVVSSVAVGAKGFRIVTAGADGTARVCDVDTGQPITPPMPHRGTVTHASFSPDGRYVVTCCTDTLKGEWGVIPKDKSLSQTARVWDATTGRPVSPPLQHYGSVNTTAWSSECHASFSPDARRVVTSSGNIARVWDATTGKPVAPPLESSGSVDRASFSPDGRHVLTGGAHAQLWDPASGRLLATFRHQAMGVSASFSPDGRYVVTASADTTALVWDVTTGQPITPPMQHGHEVSHASFSPDGRRVVTASWNGTGRVWDATSGLPLTPTMGHQKAVRAVFSPDGRRVVSTSGDNTVRVWDATTGQPITPPLKHEDRVLDASFSPDGRRVVTACPDGRAQVWDVSPDERPTADLVRLTQLFHGHRLDQYGGLVPLNPEELHSLWQELRTKYPADFTLRPDRALAWHRREAEQCLKGKNGPAALFHLLHGGLEWPILWGRPIR